MARIHEVSIPDEYTTAEDGIVDVFVGPDRKRFLVHRKLICAASPFFQSCVGTANFKEGNEGVICLPNDDPNAFALLVNWIYCGKITASGRVKIPAIIGAYVLADKFGMITCKNILMDRIIAYHSKTWCLKAVFESFRAEDFRLDIPIWKFYTQYTAYEFGKGIPLQNEEQPSEDALEFAEEVVFKAGGQFAFEVAKEMRYWSGRRADWVDPSEDTGCKFHDHSDGSKCDRDSESESDSEKASEAEEDT